MQVFVGRWSVIEMKGLGVEEHATQRLVAASSAEEAMRLLGCNQRWFSKWFNECEDPALCQTALQRPRTVFEQYIQQANGITGAQKHVKWLPLEELTGMTEQLMAKLSAPSMFEGRRVPDVSQFDIYRKHER